jgi:uncharacterized protein YdhG (YjbR/CyaY superfamily)
MKAGGAPPKDIDSYIAAAAPKAKAVLRKIRTTVRKAAPGAEELVSYGMPAFRQGGILIYFGAFKQHIGLFPPVPADAKLLAAAARYAGPKGNLQFPLDEPIPYELIARIVRHRVQVNAAKAKLKPARKKSSA